MTPPEHRYIIRKFVRATSVADALKKEKSAPVSEIFLDEPATKECVPAIGFLFCPPADIE